jgi:hypothetical protein
MAIEMHLQLQNRSRSFVVLINLATYVKRLKALPAFCRQKKNNRFHLALGIIAKPEIEAQGICVPFLM